jgi:tRNA/tmRNA/rRNA uracil-C5-methylase (TrmA/RlmC/RlmD family)
MGENLGDEVELEVTKVAHGGISVARYDGRVVFVSDAIPGETVLARISDDSKRAFWRAETVAVLQPSEFRQEHVWAAASVDRAPEDRAGGAEFGHIVPAHQRELKRQVLSEALQRMAAGETDVQVEAIPGNADGTGWRTRVRLHVAEDGTPGPYSARSHRVIPVDDLPLATAEVSAVAPLDEKFAGESVVDVIAPSSGNAWVLTGGGPQHAGKTSAAAGQAERSRLRQATVVLDPPRSGAGKAVVKELAELGPAQLVYVACDPVALARDVGLFAARGYELVRLRAFDLFPNTHHVEAVATLRR